MARAFASLRKAKKHWPQVPVVPAGEPPDEMFPSLVPIVEVAGSTWTVVLWITAWPVGTDLIDNAERGAKTLSIKLKARTLTFMANDTAGAQDLQVFEKGKQVEHEGWFDDPPPALFKKAGVHVPPCFVVKKGKGLAVGAPRAVAARIVRADVLDIGDDPY